MPSSYSGNDASVSNFDTTAISITVPVDGDAETAASVNGALEKLADYMNHVQRVFHGDDLATAFITAGNIEAGGNLTVDGNAFVDGTLQMVGGGQILSKDTPILRLRFHGTTIDNQRSQTGFPTVSSISNGSPGIISITLSGSINTNTHVQVQRGNPGAGGLPKFINAFVFDATHININTFSQAGSLNGINADEEFFLTLWQW